MRQPSKEKKRLRIGYTISANNKFIAEKQFTNYLLKNVLTKDDFTILSHFRPIGYEMDFVIVSRSFICIVEVRMEVEQDKFKRMIEQLKSNELFVKKLLDHLKIPLPIYKVLVLTSPTPQHLWHKNVVALKQVAPFLKELKEKNPAIIEPVLQARLIDYLKMRHFDKRRD